MKAFWGFFFFGGGGGGGGGAVINYWHNDVQE